jgi:hypothetical protein
MTRLHHDDDPNSEQSVDGLRKANAELKAFADYVAKDLIYAEYSQYIGPWGVDLLKRYRALTKPANSTASHAPANTVTIQAQRRLGARGDRHPGRIQGSRRGSP